MANLGGPEVHMEKSGVACHIAPSDEDALNWTRRLLGYLPRNNSEKAPKAESDRQFEILGDLTQLVPANPKKPYDIKAVLEAVLDQDSFLELQDGYARNIVIGLGRLNGESVGVVANNPQELAGCIDVNASDKAARFVRFCDAFNIPLVTFVDVPGFLPGTEQEYTGIIRHGAKLLYAYREATVPKLTVILRKSYGGAYICMCSRHLGADFVAAWPGAEIAVMGPDGAVNIVFKKEIAAGAKTAEECKQEYIDKFANPGVAASMGYVDAVIDPADTRRQLVLHLASLAGKKQAGPARKHGNIPL
jgi:acetyl-CoA carboxylase carboxyltransferase component